MALPATFAQQEVIDFIGAHLASKGWPPTQAEIAKHFGILPNAARDRLRALEKKGLVRITPNTARGIALCGPSHHSESK